MTMSPPKSYFVYRVSQRFTKLCAVILLRLKVYGLEHIPLEGG